MSGQCYPEKFKIEAVKQVVDRGLIIRKYTEFIVRRAGIYGRNAPDGMGQPGILFNGCRICSLAVVDNFSRECLANHVDQELRGEDTVAVTVRLKALRQQVSEQLQTDNGSKFISKTLDHWAYENGITIDFLRSGKPTDNALIESFNASFGDECLKAHGFLSLGDA